MASVQQQVDSQGHRTVFVSDTHGYLDQLVRVLQDSGLVNDAGDWIAGDSASLVHLGDLVDRGPKSVETYRYVRRLQDQAGRKRVKILMGNHDVQYLIDYMYCHDKKAEYEQIRSELRAEMMRDLKVGNLQFACTFNDGEKLWLCTHGGLDPRWERLNEMSTPQAADEINRLGRECVLDGAHHLEILGVDEHRVGKAAFEKGDFDPIPGVTWADVEANLRGQEKEMGHNQIVGHRPQYEINLSEGGKIWAINLPYGMVQMLVHEPGMGFSHSALARDNELIQWHNQAPRLATAGPAVETDSHSL